MASTGKQKKALFQDHGFSSMSVMRLAGHGPVAWDESEGAFYGDRPGM